jgi:hypothetical protein
MAVLSWMPKTAVRCRGSAVGEGFVELPVGVEPLQGGGESPEGAGDPDSADGSGFQGGESVDEQVRVRGARPLVAADVQPVEDGVTGEVVERADTSGDDESAVAEVDVVEE